MEENVDNLILEQLKAIRADLSDVKGRLENVEVSQRSMEGMMTSMFGYMRNIDLRVEHIEEKLEIDQ